MENPVDTFSEWPGLPRSRPVASLVTLPTELLLEIVDRLSTLDLLHLRLLSRSHNGRFRDLHQTADFSVRTYFLARHSLEILHRLSWSEYASKVKQLRLDVKSPLPDPSGVFEMKPESNFSNSSGISQEWIRKTVDEVVNSHYFGEDEELLTSALTRFPNLKSICFINSDWVGSARNFNIYFPGIEFRYLPFAVKLEYISKRADLGFTFASHFFNVLNAVASSGVQLEKICLDLSIINPLERARGVMFGISDRSFKLSEYKANHYATALGKLRHLDLILDSGDSISRQAVSYRPDGQPHVSDFVANFRESLEQLQICHDTTPGPAMLSFVGLHFRFADPIPSFPKLRILNLQNIICLKEDLQKFLKTVKTTLRELKLTRVLMANPVIDWIKILELLEEEFNLSQFYLFPLATLGQDAAVSLPILEYEGTWKLESLFNVYCSTKSIKVPMKRQVLEVLKSHYMPVKFWETITALDTVPVLPYDSDTEFDDYAIDYRASRTSTWEFEEDTLEHSENEAVAVGESFERRDSFVSQPRTSSTVSLGPVSPI